jgi:hypothetical protein
MLPDQVKMVERLSDKPFSLIGINSDHESRSALKKRFEEEKVSWPQFIEGSERGISIKWNIHAYPTLFIIDHEGVIRARGHMGVPEVNKVVDDLLEKVPGPG